MSRRITQSGIKRTAAAQRAGFSFPQGRLLVFAKAPIPGHAKTRLAGKLGARGAARLQARLTRHSVKTAVAARLAPLQLWYATRPVHAFFAACRREYPLTLHAQHGSDLGWRMQHALAVALHGSRYAVLMGSDCPALTSAVLKKAFKTLSSGADVVLVPALDGGYVLIGVRHSAARLFQGISWGSEHVLAQTRVRLRRLGLSWVELPPLADVDRPQDLRGLRLIFGR